MDFLDAIFYLAYGMVILAAAATVILPLYNSIGQPKTLVTGGIGIAGLLVIFLIGWALSGSEVTPIYRSFGVEETGSKVIGGMLTSMYILTWICVGGIIYSEVKQLFLK
jgi:hypothetical protein